MVVRVIGENPEVLKKCSCHGCGALLEYGLKDISKYEGTDYSGGPDGREWINCPRCGHKIVLRSW